MPRPALTTLIPYTLGIFVAGFLPIPIFWLWLIALIFIIGAIALQRFCHPALLAAIFVCGMLRLGIVMTSPIPSHFYSQELRFSGRTMYQPQRGELWEECYAVGIIQSVTATTQAVKAKILIRFREPIALHYGDTIEVEGILRQAKGKRNPGGFDYRAYLARRQIFGILYPSRDLEIKPIHQSGFPLLRWMERLRRRVESVTDKMYGDTRAHAQLLKGMLLGKRSGISDVTIGVFQNSGVLHILAVSGLHVGLIAAVCFFGFSLFHLPEKVTCFLTITAVIVYACLVGFRTSVLRASLMVILYLIGVIIDRDVDSFNLLAFVALVLLLINPAQLWDVGFQLTFAATGSIVYLLPKWNNFITHRLPILNSQTKNRTKIALKWLMTLFGVTLSAQVGATLIIAWHFYRAYPIGLIASPIVVQLAALIVPVGLISIILGMIWLPFAIPFVYANHLFLFMLLGIIEFFAKLWSPIKMTRPSFGLIAVYIAGCLAVAHWRWAWERRRKAALIGLAVLAIWIWDMANRNRGNLLEITFLDVGQGDAAFVRFPDGKTMLIDSGINSLRIDKSKDGSVKWVGFDSGERILDPFLCHEGIFKLDLLLLSHPDNDHGGGFAHILREFDVGRVLGVPHQNLRAKTHQVLHEIIDLKGIPHELGYAGPIDLTSTAQLELLHPFDEASTNLTDRDVNDDSLVLKLTYGTVNILFTGDIEQDAELRLIESRKDLKSEIIKVPHHGSRTSSTAEFLDAVRPRYAIFSLGERNRYGFPADAVIKRYRDRNCRVLRTDRLGAIRLRTDGRQCWIIPYAGR